MMPNRRVDRPIVGIVLVVIATVFSATSDAAAKMLSADLPGVEVIWIRYVCFMAIVLASIGFRRSKNVLLTTQPRLQVWRGLLVIISSVLFVTGLQYLPISVATTTFYISPIFVTALSILFLNESVGRRRWIATIVGLCGVILVVRPGTSAFTLAALLPISSAVFWAGALIVTRKISGLEQAQTTLLYTALVGLVVLTALLPFNWVTPTVGNVALGIFIGFAATSGQWLIIFAYRYADASVLAPFSYVQIIWASMIGFSAFGEVSDRWTYIGAAVIMASGVYTAHRERIRRRDGIKAALAAARPLT